MPGVRRKLPHSFPMFQLNHYYFIKSRHQHGSDKLKASFIWHMFHHILAALPEYNASTISLNEALYYDALKKAVLHSLKANHPQLIEEALSTVELGDTRPTQLVIEIKRWFADGLH